MKKLLFVLLATAMLFGCQKKDSETTPQFQDVSFNATEVLPEIGSRSMDDWICKDVDPTNAWVAISFDGVTTDYYPELYVVDGKLYTQSLKLAVGTNYCIENFVLYKEVNGTPGYQNTDPETDIITHGTPLTTSAYAGYVTPSLPYCFDVDEFEKEEINIEVLCFEDVDYTEFGFDWFEITELELSGFCFFGDICLNGEPFTPTDFAGSLYDNYLAVDVPAIMQILVFNDGQAVANPSFNNEADPTVPLCAYYYDDPAVDNEVFTFELYLWLPDETGFSYQLYYTYTSTDDGELMLDDNTTLADVNDNGLLDFVVGTCNYNDIDQTFSFLWTPPAANFESFPIRNNNAEGGTIYAPWDDDMYLIENAAGNGFSTSTPQSGQKMGYGTHQFDGVQINTINTVDFDILVGNQSTPPYINFWVTDGTNYAVISSENNYRGTDFMTRQEWKVFETNTANLNWFFDSGTGGVTSQYLTRNGVKVTLADFSNNIILQDPGSPYPAAVGTGAPRGGYGFQLINGDTQSNYTNPFIVENIIVTIGGVTYNASN